MKLSVGVNTFFQADPEDMVTFTGTHEELFTECINYVLRECNTPENLDSLAHQFECKPTISAVRKKLKATNHFDALLDLFDDAQFAVRGPTIIDEGE